MDKQTLRERVWDELEERGVARFPFPPHDRIPNFEGADAAAERLAETDAWRAAETVKANPDSPQLPVRRRALRAGKTVYMAVPRLRDERPFMRLDPDAIADTELDRAATVSHAASYAEQVGPAAMPAVDLVVSGSVAVSERGARVGKGEGYSDLEFAVLRAFDRVDGDTPTATTVHGVQVRRESWEESPHDVPMDRVVTPERTVETGRSEKPAGVDWSALDAERVAEMPVLDALR